MGKKKIPSKDDLINWWLFKFHTTNIKEVVEKYPEEVKFAEWFKLFPVTKSQYSEWETWAKNYLKVECKLTKWQIKQVWWKVILDCSPYVKPDKYEKEA